MDNPFKRAIGTFDRKTWIGLVAGGLFLGIGARVLKSRGVVTVGTEGDDTVPIVVSEPIDELAGSGVSGTTWPGFSSNPSWLTPGSGQTAPPPTTNDEWARLAVSDLVAHAYSPTAANNAVVHYLSGDGLTDPIERAWIDEVIRRIGAPPTPPPAQFLDDIPLGNDIAPLPTPPSTPTTPAPPAVAPRRVLSIGMGTKSNPDPLVRALQQWLRSNTGQKIAVDGAFGPQTQAAVTNFQNGTNWSSPRTPGVVDAATWATIDFVSGQLHVPAPQAS